MHVDPKRASVCKGSLRSHAMQALQSAPICRVAADPVAGLESPLQGSRRLITGYAYHTSRLTKLQPLAEVLEQTDESKSEIVNFC
jgi:hypothetical protein